MVTVASTDFTYSSEYEDEYGTDTSPCELKETLRFFDKFAPAAYIVIFILAVLGNILVLFVIHRYRQSHHSSCSFSLTDTFLLHLAISDLLLALTLPLFALQWIYGWVFSKVICKVAGALFSLNIYCGILFLACISFDRYLAIVHVVQTSWRQNTCLAQLVCAGIWCCCTVLAAIDIYFRQVSVLPGFTLQVCHVQYNKDDSGQWQLGMQLLCMLLGFGLPLLIMLYCYIRIFHTLCHKSTRRQKRRSLRLIISLVVVFVLCWAPYNILKLIDSLLILEILSPSCNLHYVLDISILVTESMGLAHSALNPLLYGFVGVKFRHELFRMFKSALRYDWCYKTTSQVQSHGMSRRPTGSFSSVDSENTSYFSVVA